MSMEIEIGVPPEVNSTLAINNYRKSDNDVEMCKNCEAYKWLRNLQVNLCSQFIYGIAVNRYYVCDKFNTNMEI